MVVVGQGALRGTQGANALAASWRLIAASGGLRADWHGFNVLHTAAARVAALDLGFASGQTARQMAQGSVDVLFLLGADEFDAQAIPPGTFVIYQGHHGDAGARRADVILPGAAYTEKNGTWVNSEGRVQRGFAATHPPGDAKEDWRILRALSARLGVKLTYDDLGAVRDRLVAVNPVFGRVDQSSPRGCADPTGPIGGTPQDCAFPRAVAQYCHTDPISRASDTMAACIAARAPVPALAAE
jgi:NADH-quinone oxidoreductase subunit G